MTRRASCFAAAALAAAASAARAQSATAEDVAVTPYRPTVSTPAALSAPGWLEAEAGLQRLAVGSATPRDSVPYSIKLAFSDDWGVRISGESWVRNSTADGRRVTGLGDTALVLKGRFALSGRSAFGLEIDATAPTAPAGLHSGSGKADFGVTGIYSADFGAKWHADLNLGATRLGAAEPSESRDAVLWAVALANAVDPSWGLIGEFSGSRRTGTDAIGQLLLAATYSPQRRRTWDFGIARGMTAATAKWTIFAGGTFLVTRLF